MLVTQGPAVPERRPTDGDAAPPFPIGELLRALRAFRRGDFSARMPFDQTGVAGEVAQVFNDVVEQNDRLVKEVARLNAAIGKEGRLGQRASLGDLGGDWRACIDSLNGLIDDLV